MQHKAQQYWKLRFDFVAICDENECQIIKNSVMKFTEELTIKVTYVENEWNLKRTSKINII